jgi:hypothetical protein
MRAVLAFGAMARRSAAFAWSIAMIHAKRSKSARVSFTSPRPSSATS